MLINQKELFSNLKHILINVRYDDISKLNLYEKYANTHEPILDIKQYIKESNTSIL